MEVKDLAIGDLVQAVTYILDGEERLTPPAYVSATSMITTNFKKSIMKFTTPCFVRVEDADKRKELAAWLERIGYECAPHNKALVGTHVIAGTAFYCFVSFADGVKPHYGDDGIDCDTDIELFKALAAMNDENDREQWFVGTVENLYRFEAGGTGKVRWTYCVYDQYSLIHNVKLKCEHYAPRKATADEIIEYYKHEHNS